MSGGKCKKIFADISCEDISAFREIVDEVQETWRNLKISNSSSGSFELDFSGMKRCGHEKLANIP